MSKCNVKITSVFLLIATFVDMYAGYKILVVFPNPSRSHGNLGDGLVRHLLKAGHQVTYITPFVNSTPQNNLSYIDVSSTSKVYTENSFHIEKLMENFFLINQHRIFHLSKNMLELAFENDTLRKFLEDSSQNFDAVVAEWMFNELYSGFSAVFKCPYIWVYPFEPNFSAMSLIDEITNPAYTINFELNIAPPFTFVERVKNLLFQIFHRLNYYYCYDSLEKAVYEKVFGPILFKRHGTVVPYESLRYNASLMLIYTHNSFSQSLSIPQNLIPVGGYHVDDDPAPLPENLKDIMDNAKEGVIYFSMGSNLKSNSFPKYILKDLMKVFSEINYTVLWKFDDVTMDCSDNVHILKWAPQQSILAHPKCILFITHGGLLSTVEAVHYGIPIIGIPVFYDQFSNVDRAVSRGFAKKVTLNSNFAENLKAAIVDILTDVRYAAKAKELSFIYHDRPVSPGASLVHYVEHVVVTRGALHLRSPALLVPWYQKLYLDLGIVIFLLVCVVRIVIRLVTKCRRYQVSERMKKIA